MDAVANLMHLGPFAFEYFKGRTTAVPASMPALPTGYHFFPRFVLVIICHCQAAFRPPLLLRPTDGYQIRYAPQPICHARGHGRRHAECTVNLNKLLSEAV
jgi:hypothetical protein